MVKVTKEEILEELTQKVTNEYKVEWAEQAYNTIMSMDKKRVAGHLLGKPIELVIQPGDTNFQGRTRRIQISNPHTLPEGWELVSSLGDKERQ